VDDIAGSLGRLNKSSLFYYYNNKRRFLEVTVNEEEDVGTSSGDRLIMRY
jgi:hypothetical protein